MSWQPYTKRLKISELKCAYFIMLSCIHSQYFVTYSEVYTHGSWTVPIWKSCNSLNWRVVFKAITYTRSLLGEVHVLQFQVQWSNSVENVLRNISACSLFLRRTLLRLWGFILQWTLHACIWFFKFFLWQRGNPCWKTLSILKQKKNKTAPPSLSNLVHHTCHKFN